MNFYSLLVKGIENPVKFISDKAICKRIRSLTALDANILGMGREDRDH